jgi:hypothetical protein
MVTPPLMGVARRARHDRHKGLAAASWLDTGGQIVLTMPYVEMGQGTYTSVPMLIAEVAQPYGRQLAEHATGGAREVRHG